MHGVFVTTLLIIVYLLIGWLVQYFLIASILIDAPRIKVFGWKPRNWWVLWMNSWIEFDPKNAVKNVVPPTHPVLNRLYYPLKLFLWPLDLIMTIIGRYTT